MDKNNGFVVPPDNPAQLTPDELNRLPLPKGAKVRVQRRVQAFDPYSREYFSVYPHTLAVVVSPRDAQILHQGYVTVMLRSSDNGNGRVVQIPQTELVSAAT